MMRKNNIDIAKVRNKIADIDKNIAKLFEERMNEAKKVAEYKKERGIAILDSDQEKKVLERNAGFIKDINLQKYFNEVTKSLMDVSKDYQRYLNEGMRVCFTGTYGAFGHIAASKIFDKTDLPCFPTFEETFEEVENGNFDCCVLPIENSFAGDVNPVIDLLFSGNLYINAAYVLKVNQNLLGVKGAKLSDIKTVISHEQAINQCYKYIKDHKFKVGYESNTAIAAQKVLEKNDKSLAAIASVGALKFFDLQLLDKDINTSRNNTTMFAVLSKTPYEDKSNDTFVLMFTLNKDLGSGALIKALKVFSDYNVNITALRSRPLKRGKFTYYFYAVIEGNPLDKNIKTMMKKLKDVCSEVKYAGSYKIRNL